MTANYPPQDWQDWAHARETSARAPYGILTLVATSWLTDEQTIEGLPGLWSSAPEGLMRLKATAADELVLDGHAVDGVVLLAPDTAASPSVLAHRDLKLVPILREGEVAVRIYDPAAPNLRSFDGIDRYAYDETLIVPAAYRPYDEVRIEAVPNADGHERGLTLTGEVHFQLDGQVHILAATLDEAGIGIVFGDTTNGRTTFGFRRLTLPAPDADGTTVIDFNRAWLPPCAFSDHFICPLPPVGNRLAVAIEAGERQLRIRK
ncbi:MAG: DUF1684 domain-containing protein [Catenulispora sp.]